jgi:hypothetical protein
VGLLYEQQSALAFLLVTVLLGGGGGWLSGRAIALTWQPWWMALPASLGLAVAVRFFHRTLFDGTLLSLHYFAVDAVILLLLALAGYRVTRARQMTVQYGFLQRKHAPCGAASPDNGQKRG